MRGIKKKALMLSVIASLLVTVLTIVPAFAATTILSAPEIEDENLVPGASFSIDITVADVMAMWGYDFFLSYDPDVLTATSFESLQGFVLPWPSEINNVEGYVAMAFSYPMRDPFGFDAVAAAPIATIYFTVEELGFSALDLHDSVISDVVGATIPHELDDGFFINIPVVREADLVRRRAWPEHHDYRISKDEDTFNTLYGSVFNTGNKPTCAKVVFTIYEDAMLFGTLETTTVTLQPYQPGDKPAVLSVDFAVDVGMLGSEFFVEVQVEYDSTGDCTLDAIGARTKTTSFVISA